MTSAPIFLCANPLCRSHCGVEFSAVRGLEPHWHFAGGFQAMLSDEEIAGFDPSASDNLCACCAWKLRAVCPDKDNAPVTSGKREKSL